MTRVWAAPSIRYCTLWTFARQELHQTKQLANERSLDIGSHSVRLWVLNLQPTHPIMASGRVSDGTSCVVQWFLWKKLLVLEMPTCFQPRWTRGHHMLPLTFAVICLCLTASLAIPFHGHGAAKHSAQEEGKPHCGSCLRLSVVSVWGGFHSKTAKQTFVCFFYPACIETALIWQNYLQTKKCWSKCGSYILPLFQLQANYKYGKNFLFQVTRNGPTQQAPWPSSSWSLDGMFWVSSDNGKPVLFHPQTYHLKANSLWKFTQINSNQFKKHQQNQHPKTWAI